MGLDMFLYKKDHRNDRTTSLATWRKFNALHNWFVLNCQNGIDANGEDTQVSEEQLERLLDILKRIEGDRSLAPELLPTTRGFFFGGTEYDDWYFQDVSRTIRILEKVLKGDTRNIFYVSSW